MQVITDAKIPGFDETSSVSKNFLKSQSTSASEASNTFNSSFSSSLGASCNRILSSDGVARDNACFAQDLEKNINSFLSFLTPN